MVKNRNYFIINLIFLIILGVVFGYSYFFYPNDQPIQCVVKAYTGKNCPSCGFSRAFSAFTHLKYEEGMAYNTHAFKAFLFFLFQFTLRSVVSVAYFKKPDLLSTKFIIAELTITIALFLVVFLPLLSY